MNAIPGQGPYEPRERVCVALDVDRPDRALELARLLREHVGVFKVGLELFTRAGPSIVDSLRELGARVFLDLKFHDIPNTVAGAARSATRLGASMFTIHASGGRQMIAAAVSAAVEAASTAHMPPPIILAVTVLTSIDQATLSGALLTERTVLDIAQHLAVLARDAGASGVIASPHEASMIRSACGPGFKIVTPGIRPANAATGDQKRITTPREAIALGADYIVVGRPILSAPDPVRAARAIAEEIAKG